MKGITIQVLRCGETTIDYELALTASPDELLTTERDHNRRRRLPHPIYTYVVDHPEGRMLIDTGVNAEFLRQWRKGFYVSAMPHDPGEDGLFTQQLAARNLGPEDFDWVLLTHLHTDHAGNAPMFRTAGAKILVHEDELRGAITVKGGLLRDDDVTLWGVTSQQGFVRSNFGFLVPDRATTVYGDVEVMKDVWLVSLPGHTWGTMGVAVRLEHQGWVLLASDAIYLADTYRVPFVGTILNQNQEVWARSAVKVRRLAEKYDMRILPGHDDHCVTGIEDGRASVEHVGEEYR